MWPLIWVPAFLSTVTLLPLLMTFLLSSERKHSPTKFWAYAAMSGVVALAVAPQKMDVFGRLMMFFLAPFLFAVTFGIVLPQGHQS